MLLSKITSKTSNFNFLKPDKKSLVKKVSRETLNTSARVLEMCIASEQLSLTITSRLQSHEDKLRQIAKNLISTDETLEEVEDNLKKLERSCCCVIFYMIRKNVCNRGKPINSTDNEKERTCSLLSCFRLKKPSLLDSENDVIKIESPVI